MAEFIGFIIVTLLAFFFVWLFAYKHFIDIQKDLSINIISEIVPDIQSSHNLITTLSASAIVLSFTVLQTLKDHKLTYLSYLENSWLFFSFAILFGVLSGIIIYIFKAHSSVVVQKLVDYHEGREIDKKRLASLTKIKSRHQSMLFGFLLGQSVSFVAAIAFLVAFAKNNLS